MSPDAKQLRKSKILYFIDEFSILLFALAAVVISEAFIMRAKGQMATTDVIYLDWLNLVISAMLALISYGSLHTQWKYNDKSKPAYYKRVISAVSNGVMWRTIMGWKE